MMTDEAEKEEAKKPIHGMTANVERQSFNGTCGDWRKRGEHKREHEQWHEAKDE